MKIRKNKKGFTHTPTSKLSLFGSSSVSLQDNHKSTPYAKRKLVCGFTLIELLVTIAIIGILSSVVVTSVLKHKARARDAVRASQMEAIKEAVNLFFSDNGYFPATATFNSLDVLNNSAPRDPQGRAYSYRFDNDLPPKSFCIGTIMETLPPQTPAPCSTGASTDNYTIKGP